MCAMKQNKLTRPRCDRRGHTVTTNSIFRALSEHTDHALSCWHNWTGLPLPNSFVYPLHV